MNRYRDFFLESTEGQAYMQSLNDLIDRFHQKGENKPEMSRDYMQRAKGVREAIALIQVMTAVSGKKRERLLDEAKHLGVE